MIVLEVLLQGHPHIQDILRVPIVPILRIENKLVIILFIVRLVKGVLVIGKDRVVMVLIVDTHFYLLLLRFVSLVRRRGAKHASFAA
jgi:hypothetical protein